MGHHHNYKLAEDTKKINRNGKEVIKLRCKVCNRLSSKYYPVFKWKEINAID